MRRMRFTLLYAGYHGNMDNWNNKTSETIFFQLCWHGTFTHNCVSNIQLVRSMGWGTQHFLPRLRETGHSLSHSTCTTAIAVSPQGLPSVYGTSITLHTNNWWHVLTTYKTNSFSFLFPSHSWFCLASKLWNVVKLLFCRVSFLDHSLSLTLINTYNWQYYITSCYPAVQNSLSERKQSSRASFTFSCWLSPTHASCTQRTVKSIQHPLITECYYVIPYSRKFSPGINFRIFHRGSKVGKN